jgi:hypothetical protein
MRYTLWSRSRLVGHTDLDIHTITPTMREGFIEPTVVGRQLLADATGVWRAMAEAKRGRRARGGVGANDSALIRDAVLRRQGLDLELRDKHGAVFDCEFIRVTDLFDLERVVDEMSDTEEEEEAEFEISLSGLSGQARDDALSRRAETDAEISTAVADMREEQDEGHMFGSAWPPAPPEDPRWETMQYLIQVHVRGDEWDEDP